MNLRDLGRCDPGGVLRPAAWLRIASVVLGAAAAFHTTATAQAFLHEPAEGGGTIITKYQGVAAEVVVPASIGSQAVVAIGDRAFAGRVLVTRVDLPQGVISLGGAAFAGCAQLRTITLPAGSHHHRGLRVLRLPRARPRGAAGEPDGPRRVGVRQLPGPWAR